MDSEIDLYLVTSDGSFGPYEYKTTPQPTSKTNGRIFVLKFASSSQRYLFWMQSKPQGSGTDASYFSPRDRKIGEIVNRVLQGEDFPVEEEVDELYAMIDRHNDDDDDETMEDVQGQNSGSRQRHGSGGAGAGATGGDIREEGEESREGGSDGARA